MQLAAQRELRRSIPPTEASHVPPTSIIWFPLLHAPILNKYSMSGGSERLSVDGSTADYGVRERLISAR